MRASWVESRKGQANVSQMHYARQGVVTEEMAHVAVSYTHLTLPTKA